jgi:carbon-monoxide dehydrogenase medium subunit
MCKKVARLRRLPEIECLFPKTVDEALSMLESHNGATKVMAGGTDVINKLKRRNVVARYIVDLKGIPDLDFIENGAGGLRIGAVTTLTDILESPLVSQSYPILTDAVSVMASPQIRNTASMVGNLCNAVPSADASPPLIVLQAKLKIVDGKKEKAVLVEDFFIGPGETVLAPGELVKEIVIPQPELPGAGAYLKYQLRSEMDLAVVGVGAYLTLDAEKTTCKAARIALGAVAPIPMRARKAEDVLQGKKLSDDLIETAARIASEESKPIDDIRSSSEYRRNLVEVLTKRAIRQCLDRA